MKSRSDTIEADHDLMSSAEALTFVVRRLLRSVSLMLDVVRRMTLRPISSHEHSSAGLDR
jgi:hypothetical protein